MNEPHGVTANLRQSVPLIFVEETGQFIVIRETLDGEIWPRKLVWLMKERGLRFGSLISKYYILCYSLTRMSALARRTLGVVMKASILEDQPWSLLIEFTEPLALRLPSHVLQYREEEGNLYE